MCKVKKKIGKLINGVKSQDTDYHFWGGDDWQGTWGVFLGAGNTIFLDIGSVFSDVFAW